MTRNELDWPSGFERTDPDEREDTTKFEKSRRETVKDILTELNRLGTDHERIETDADHQKQNNNIPYAESTASDPGAVVRWRMDERDYAVACDYYTDLRDNLRAIYLYIHEKRMMDNRPVETGQSEFATARLPPADGDVDVVAAEPPAHEILGVSPDATPEEIKEAERELMTEVHPDHGGDPEDFQQVKKAKRTMLSNAS